MGFKAWFKRVFESKKHEEEDTFVPNSQEQEIIVPIVKSPKVSDFDEEDNEDFHYKEPEEEERIAIISALLSNNTLTIILDTGEIYSRASANKALYDKATQCSTKEALMQIMAPELSQKEKQQIVTEEREQLVKDIQAKEEQKQYLEIKSQWSTLKAYKDFDVRENAVYLKGIERSMPKLLIEKFGELIEKKENVDTKNWEVEYIALKRFWMWCCINPYPQAADELFEFLEKSNKCLRLNKQGFFYAVRNVVTVKNTNTKLVEFVSNTYTHVKATWKKKPDNYIVFKDKAGVYGFCKDGKAPAEETIGNLGELYRNITELEGNRFTDNHTKTFDIRVGKRVYEIPTKSAWSKDSCASGGLHFTLNQIHQVGCGDTSVLILINPAKVVALGRDGHKGRTYEYFPVMSMPLEEANIILRDKSFDTLQLDEMYAEEELKQLEEAVKGVSKGKYDYTFNLEGVDTKLVKNVAKSLGDIKKELTKRVKEIA